MEDRAAIRNDSTRNDSIGPNYVAAICSLDNNPVSLFAKLIANTKYCLSSAAQAEFLQNFRPGSL
jgi:hypothetical protein